MNKSVYTLEPEYKVWDEENGVYVKVAPDADGLGCIEISYEESGSVDRISVPPAMALLIAEAIKRIAEHMIAENGK